MVLVGVGWGTKMRKCEGGFDFVAAIVVVVGYFFFLGFGQVVCSETMTRFAYEPNLEKARLGSLYIKVCMRCASLIT